MSKLFIVILMLCLTGCAGRYSCNGLPDAKCAPVSHVYETTNDSPRDEDYRRTLFNKESNNVNSQRTTRNGKTRRPSRVENQININVGQANRVMNYLEPGDPVLTKPVIMRILINSWEDKDKDLHAAGYVYIRVRESAWETESR